MKKTLFLLLTPLLLFSTPFFVSADVLSVGVQSNGGTITEYYACLNSSNATDVTVNGVSVTSITNARFSGGNGCGTNTDLSIPFNAGDDIEIVNAQYGGSGSHGNIITVTFNIVSDTGSTGTSIANISLSTSTGVDMMRYASGLFSDSGFLTLFGIIVGVPFGFWLISAVIDLFTYTRKEDKRLKKK